MTPCRLRRGRTCPFNPMLAPNFSCSSTPIASFYPVEQEMRQGIDVLILYLGAPAPE